MIEILDRYGLKCTFNLNSEFLGLDGTLDRNGRTVRHDKIAKDKIKEVYKNDEYPYIVKLNETANAWIVHGSSGTCAGGVASIAIDRNNGEILMLIHTK